MTLFDFTSTHFLINIQYQPQDITLFQLCQPGEVTFELKVRVGDPSSENRVSEDTEITDSEFPMQKGYRVWVSLERDR